MRFVAECVGWAVIAFGSVFGVAACLYAMAALAWHYLDRNARAVGMAWVARKAREKNQRARADREEGA